MQSGARLSFFRGIRRLARPYDQCIKFAVGGLARDNMLVVDKLVEDVVISNLPERLLGVVARKAVLLEYRRDVIDKADCFPLGHGSRNVAGG